MKVAVACEGEKVSEHFGHCGGFFLFETEGKQISGKSFLPFPGHRPGFLPVFLHEHGANVIIAGGMGGGAIDIFQEKGIEVIVGASGDAEEAVKKYLLGELQSTGSVCHDHQHADECGE